MADTITIVRDRKHRRVSAGPDWSRSAPLHREQEFVDWYREQGHHVVVVDGELFAPYTPVGFE